MGLFGMAVFMASQRQREIAIRKVSGATSTQVVLLLSKEFGKVILVSIMLAWVISWYILKLWLEHFAYSVKQQPLTFLISGVLVLLFAGVITVIIALYYSEKSPAKVLKYE
jgi:putative ABC transport system permease protein